MHTSHPITVYVRTMLEDLTPPKNLNHRCKINTTALELTAEDRVVFDAAIEDTENWKANTLSTQLRQRGIKIGDMSITRHRQKICACYRKRQGS